MHLFQWAYNVDYILNQCSFNVVCLIRMGNLGYKIHKNSYTVLQNIKQYTNMSQNNVSSAGLVHNNGMAVTVSTVGDIREWHIFWNPPTDFSFSLVALSDRRHLYSRQ